MKQKELTFKVDGFEAEFTTEAQIVLIKHLDERLTFWREIATAYKEALEVIVFLKDKLRREN